MRGKYILEMTNEILEKIGKILEKFKSYEGKLLTIQKRIKALEDKPCLESEGGFLPNEKFYSWYQGSFADSEDDQEEVEEEEEEPEEVPEVLEETVEETEEILEKLDEVIDNG